MTTTARVKEIFVSIQGEGPLVGYKQLFIRFCGCNLNCDYCDTDFASDKHSIEFTPKQLKKHVEQLNIKGIHSVALTGGEPLIHSTFLKEFIPMMKNKIYLETNATMPEAIKELEPVMEFIDYIAADIKLPSASGLKDSFNKHFEFFNAVKNSKIQCAIHKQFECEKNVIFAKIVFDEKITDEEIKNCIELAKQYNLELILQPKMNGNKLSINSEQINNILNCFLDTYKKIRLIPQTHKFMNIQ